MVTGIITTYLILRLLVISGFLDIYLLAVIRCKISMPLGFGVRIFLGTSIAATAAAGCSTFPFVSAAAAQPRRIIIDADTGVDEAIAILLALRSPELKVPYA